MRTLKPLLLCGAMLTCAAAQSKVVLPAIFADGMVVQQKTQARLWGTAEPDKTVKIRPSWASSAEVKVKADSNGKWEVLISTPEAGGPYEITFDDGEKTTLSDVLSGELWLCSGQSNMEMPMKGYVGQPVDNSYEDIMFSSDDNMRLFTVEHSGKTVPAADVKGKWKKASPKTVREFSATAYYFGKTIRKMLNVPVGLVVSSYGGSSCEAWVPADYIKAFPKYKIPAENDVIKKNTNTPTVLYNGQIAPIIRAAYRGVIWYQGESNVPHPRDYADLFTAMIKGWRELNGNNLPLFFCQIAPYDNYKVNSALLREQQLKVSQTVENTGMAVLMDGGVQYVVHPRKKQLAGMRLAALAMQKVYGIEGVCGESATVGDVEFKNGRAAIDFNGSQRGVYTATNENSKLFEIAGPDQVFYPAEAVIKKKDVKDSNGKSDKATFILVKSDSVPNPCAVRYGFHNWVEGDLFSDGLPISSFRTDNWDK